MADKKTYYEILGVANDAGLGEIKKAYRKLMRQYHPDVSTEADADEKTSEINVAYETLKDERKRAEYDAMLANPFAGQQAGGFGADFDPRRYGYESHDFSGSHFGEGQPFGSGDFRFDDIFSAFGHAGRHGFRASQSNEPIQGEDQHAELSIDIAAAYQGSERTLSLDMPTLTADGKMAYARKTLHVKIPKGILEGQQIRLRGQGLPGFNGGGNGDLYLNIRFRQAENLYVEQRKDVCQRIDVMPWTAALGGKMAVETVAGKFSVNIPLNSRNGQRLRLKSKGIPAKERGDLYLILNIVLPQVESESDKAAWQHLADYYQNTKG
ncbi:DNA-binding protein [Chelonobacter oris]|uniref:DNA-binding protein n=1 Tax=Chelonobacter oris TaxID=505317 RepID=A0A0A3ATN9_9PAST|nr:DnaJ C-terminal domain-containing protein [Chelonobacter oris]KGQ71117.1 DNA-binding protein [Chelonobacter oris]